MVTASCVAAARAAACGGKRERNNERTSEGRYQVAQCFCRIQERNPSLHRWLSFMISRAKGSPVFGRITRILLARGRETSNQNQVGNSVLSRSVLRQKFSPSPTYRQQLGKETIFVPLSNLAIGIKFQLYRAVLPFKSFRRVYILYIQ